MRDTGYESKRVVVGGGLFGCYAALVLADYGHDVLLIEQSSTLMSRASFVNQARLHTGLHYPRSILTATEALSQYRKFRARFPQAIRDFRQIYAISAHNSKTSAADFTSFVARLGVNTDEVDPMRWFRIGTVSRAFEVEEPSFDSTILCRLLLEEISARPNIAIQFNTSVIGGTALRDRVVLHLDNERTVEAEGVFLATYAGTNALRHSLGLTPMPLTFELTEVLLGNVSSELSNMGFTVMDGPFWSMMPFGHSDQVTLTSVGLTPLRRSKDEASFDCQSLRDGCTALQLADCTQCHVRPASASIHQLQQVKLFLKNEFAFRPTRSLLTVKAILSTSQVDDARPTLIHREPDLNVTTIFSGKVSTLFDLEKELS